MQKRDRNRIVSKPDPSRSKLSRPVRRKRPAFGRTYMRTLEELTRATFVCTSGKKCGGRGTPPDSGTRRGTRRIPDPVEARGQNCPRRACPGPWFHRLAGWHSTPPSYEEDVVRASQVHTKQIDMCCEVLQPKAGKYVVIRHSRASSLC